MIWETLKKVSVSIESFTWKRILRIIQYIIVQNVAGKSAMASGFVRKGSFWILLEWPDRQNSYLLGPYNMLLQIMLPCRTPRRWPRPLRPMAATEWMKLESRPQSGSSCACRNESVWSYDFLIGLGSIWCICENWANKFAFFRYAAAPAASSSSPVMSHYIWGSEM